MRPATILLPAIGAPVVAGCGAKPAAGDGASPSRIAVTQAPATTPAAAVAASPYFPPGPICRLYALDLAVWRSAVGRSGRHRDPGYVPEVRAGDAH
jgi:hypothetical protein